MARQNVFLYVGFYMGLAYSQGEHSLRAGTPRKLCRSDH